VNQAFSENFKVAPGGVEADFKAREKAGVPKETHADVLQCVTETGVEREAERFLAGWDLLRLHRQDGYFDLFVVGDLRLVAGAGEERAARVREVDAESKADGGGEDAVIRAGVDSGVGNHAFLALVQEQGDDRTIEGCPVWKRSIWPDPEV
jgi:hypothetical protein